MHFVIVKKNLLVFLCAENGCQVLRHYRLVDVVIYVITSAKGTRLRKRDDPATCNNAGRHITALLSDKTGETQIYTRLIKMSLGFINKTSVWFSCDVNV